jgi:YVTN family beta-propeller protein
MPALSETEPARPEDIAISTDGEAPFVWLGDTADARVLRVSATSPDDVETFPVPASVTGIAVGAGGVWVASGDVDTVTLLDEGSGAVLTSLDVSAEGCDQPEAIAVGGGSVWVACRTSGSILAIDPKTRAVTTSLDVEGAPVALATDEHGRVWLAVGPA